MFTSSLDAFFSLSGIAILAAVAYYEVKAFLFAWRYATTWPANIRYKNKGGNELEIVPKSAAAGPQVYSEMFLKKWLSNSPLMHSTHFRIQLETPKWVSMPYVVAFALQLAAMLMLGAPALMSIGASAITGAAGFATFSAQQYFEHRKAQETRLNQAWKQIGKLSRAA